LPEAFAGVPVLAQPGGGLGQNNRQSNVQNQGMGGGMGGMGMGGMGMGGMGMGGMGMGMMNIPPEQVRQLKVQTVCLEHGKKEPRPNIPYEMRPIESFTNNRGVHELLKLFGAGEINQRVAQAAAWHLANDMSWEQLASKRVHHLLGEDEPWFSPAEIQAAMQLAERAEALAGPPEPESSRSARDDLSSAR
jgi:hypothetical protein